MGSGVVESGTGASALQSAFISAKVSQRSQTRIKDDLSVLTSHFYIQELYELIFKVFLHISALSQLCTCALLSNFSYFIFQVIHKDINHLEGWECSLPGECFFQNSLRVSLICPRTKKIKSRLSGKIFCVNNIFISSGCYFKIPTRWRGLLAAPLFFPIQCVLKFVRKSFLPLGVFPWILPCRQKAFVVLNIAL